MNHQTEKKRMQPSIETSVSEMLILHDGRILAHNITPTMARVLAKLDPADEAMRRRANRQNSVQGERIVDGLSGCVPPHPDPLPRGEGTAAEHADKLSQSRSSFPPLPCQGAGNNSPSPWGEGRGEGERSDQISNAAVRK